MSQKSKLIDELYNLADNYFKEIGYINNGLNSRIRRTEYNNARMIYVNILVTHSKFSNRVIGTSIHRDYSTVSHYNNLKHLIFSDRELSKMLIELQSILLPKLNYVDPFEEKQKDFFIHLYHNCL